MGGKTGREVGKGFGGAEGLRQDEINCMEDGESRGRSELGGNSTALGKLVNDKEDEDDPGKG